MKILGIIPARAGSKRVPNKNKRLLNGKELVRYTIETCIESKLLTKIVVSSDDLDILNIAKNYTEVIALERPEEISQDKSLALEFVHHALKSLNENYDIVVIIQVSSPFTQAIDIDQTINVLLENDQAKSAASVVKLDHALQPSKIKLIKQGQLISYFKDEADKMIAHELPELYIRNGSVYVSRVETIRSGNIITEPCMAYVMPRERSLDINDEMDWGLAEYMMGDYKISFK